MTTDQHRPGDNHADAILPEVRFALDTAIRRRLDAITTAARPVRSHRPLWIGASFALTAAVAAVVLTVVLAASPAGGPVDVLGRARAALSPKGELVHYTVRVQIGRSVTGRGPDLAVRLPGPRADCARPLDNEVWQTAHPNRWRARTQGCQLRGGTAEVSTSESSWSPGTSSFYDPADRRLRVLTGLSPRSSAGTVPLGVETIGPGDPVEVIRGLLASGDLRPHGARRRDGRPVLTFTARRTENGHRTTWLTRYVYDVDPDTYEPVRVTIVRSGRPADPSKHCALRCSLAGTVGQRMDFRSFERVPLDRATERLLRIDPPPDARVERTTLSDARRAQAERRRSAARDRRRP
jgi:hypothetical protein